YFLSLQSSSSFLLYKPSSPLSHFTSLKAISEVNILVREREHRRKQEESFNLYCLFYLSLFQETTYFENMARSLSNVKIVSAFVSRELSNAIFRRGYAATAAQASVGKGGAVVSGVMKKKGVEESTQKIAWIPDPKTGYYRPETGSKEIDPAELRAALLNNKQ
ncbi:hypothetical protein HID58_053075, partial [Brassica napus]